MCAANAAVREAGFLFEIVVREAGVRPTIWDGRMMICFAHLHQSQLKGLKRHTHQQWVARP